MSKERLEEIRKDVMAEGLLVISEKDFWYLNEQAERVQELEELEQEYIELNNDFTKLALENKRYREAKKQIGEKYEYFQDAPSSVSTGLSMAIEILDKALEESE